MAMGFSTGQMVADTKVNTWMIKSTVMAHSNGLMTGSTPAPGLTGDSMVKGFIQTHRGSPARAFGLMENEIDGLTRTPLAPSVKGPLNDIIF